jgi:hypothetical protein
VRCVLVLVSLAIAGLVSLTALAVSAVYRQEHS